MNNLVIAPDQQSGTYNGRRVVAVASEELCAGCIVNADGGNAFECKDTVCREEERKDGQYIHWIYAPDPAPSDTAMLDYLLEHCTCIKEWKTGREAFESREENKPLRTREDVRRAMGGGK